MSAERAAQEAKVRAAVKGRQERKLRARREAHKRIWFGLGAFGMVGWSVAIPAVAAIALGVWLDRHHPARFSWTLTLLVAGTILGCWNAWRWVNKEQGRGGRDEGRATPPPAAGARREEQQEDRHV